MCNPMVVQWRSLYNAGGEVTVARYNACGSAYRRWEQPVVVVCGVVPIAAIIPVFPVG